MHEILDKKLKISVLVLENSPNTYYLTYQNDTKCIIDTVDYKNDIIIIPNPSENCNIEELSKILECFSNFMFKIKPELNGLLLKTDENPYLTNIGFDLLNEDSEYLYKKNDKRMNKVR